MHPDTWRARLTTVVQAVAPTAIDLSTKQIRRKYGDDNLYRRDAEVMGTAVAATIAAITTKPDVLAALIPNPLAVGTEDNPNPIRAMYDVAASMVTLHAAGDRVPDALWRALNLAGEAVHEAHPDAFADSESTAVDGC